MKKQWISILTVAALLFSLCGCAREAEPRYFFAMDTVMSLRLEGDSGVAFEACRAEVERLEALLSTTRAESEIARLNKSGALELSAETAALLAEAQRIAAETGRAFCPTLYPAVRAWGFLDETQRVPAAAELEALLPCTGAGALTLQGTTTALASGAGVDLGGIAKGYAADCLAALLEERGIAHYFLSLGGNVQVGGGRPNGAPWRVGIADPRGGEYIGVVTLAGGAVVTSGGYQRNFTENGVTYHHILDPATLRPAESGLLSATAVTENGTLADALSTAFFVMGEARAMAYCAAHPGVNCVLVTADGRVAVSEGLRAQFTPHNGAYTYDET